MDEYKESGDSRQVSASHAGQKQLGLAQHSLISKKASDHLANERTFLAWVRTGIAVMAFGLVIERFGNIVA